MLRRIFFTGLAFLIPIAITLYVIVAVFSFADGILGRFINKFLVKHIGFSIPGLGIILFVVIVFAVGCVVHAWRRKIFKYIESLFLRTPLVNKVYAAVKSIVDFLLFPPAKTYKSVVLIEYPRKGIYSMGFITNDSFTHFNEKTKKRLYSVFIPTTPTPLSGFTVLSEEHELIFLDISVEEAMKFIISGGLLNPL